MEAVFEFSFTWRIITKRFQFCCHSFVCILFNIAIHYDDNKRTDVKDDV